MGWLDGAMVLDKLPVPGRPTIWMMVGQGPIALAISAGGGCLDIFTLLYPFSPLSPSLWETARYRLKYCLKGPLKGWILCYTIDPPNLIPSNRQVIRRSKVSANHLIIKVIKYCRAETTARFRGPSGVYSLT